jgi:hypothetical protein
MLKLGNITWFELTRFSVPEDQHADGMCCAQHSGWGGHQRGCSYSYVWIMGKKLVLGWQPYWSVSSAVSYRLKVPIMEKHVLISTCILYIVHDVVLWLFSKTPLFKTMSSLGDLVIHGFRICLRYVYSRAPHNDGPHIWWWSHKTIILQYNIITFPIVLQLPTVFSTVTCCTGL